MSRHERSGRTHSNRVTLVALGIVAAAVVACDGGTADTGLEVGSPNGPAYDGGPTTDDGPLLSGSEGNPASAAPRVDGVPPAAVTPPGATPGTPPAGGGGGGGDSTSNCDGVITAIIACGAGQISSADLAQFRATCVKLPGACTTCVANGFTCAELESEASPLETRCASQCPTTNPGTDPGDDQGGGAAGSSSDGGCASAVFAKATECGLTITSDAVQSTCANFPGCQPCLTALDCGTILSGACNSSCGLQ
jgi:hypothetical protein